MDLSAQAIAPVNIAVIKYWGKKDAERVIPLNTSISMTLSTELLYTKTKVTIIPNGTGETSLTINGLYQPMTKRHERVIRKYLGSHQGVHVKSFNSFPTAAGLASSASGMAALVSALNAIWPHPDYLDITRLGSGSACRSMLGGWVEWSDLLPKQIFASEHWPEMRCLVYVLEEKEKPVCSTRAMEKTVMTSSLFKHRQLAIEDAVLRMKDAIFKKDFPAFAELVMRESNQLHAVCLDTFPPIHYLNDRSFALIDTVHSLNSRAGNIVAAYTFDAGPNAFVFTLSDYLDFTIDSLKVFSHSPIVCTVGSGPLIIKD